MTAYKLSIRKFNMKFSYFGRMPPLAMHVDRHGSYLGWKQAKSLHIATA